VKKLNCYICDDCRRVLWHNGQIPPKDIVIIGKKHYCHTCSLEDKKAEVVMKKMPKIIYAIFSGYGGFGKAIHTGYCQDIEPPQPHNHVKYFRADVVDGEAVKIIQGLLNGLDEYWATLQINMSTVESARKFIKLRQKEK